MAVNKPIICPTGVNVTIDSAVIPAVAGAAFAFQASTIDGDFSFLMQAKGTLTSLSADLQISLDAGTTWTTLAAAAIVAATSAKVITPGVAGAWYRLNYTAGTGPVTLLVASN